MPTSSSRSSALFSAHSPAHSQPVLIVDDDAPTRDTLRLLLEEIGYSVVEVADGVAALALLRTDERHFVVLLDERMPQLDGLGVLRQVWKDQHLRNQHRYIFMTANHIATRFAVLRLIAFLRVPAVQKPFDIEHLETIVARMTASLQAVVPQP